MLPPVAPVVTVQQDYGGWIQQFAARIADYRRHRVQVRVMGECDSACTLVLSLKRVCVGPRASFEFHQAFRPADPKHFVESDVENRSDEATDYLMQAYPPAVRDWIEEHGGLGPDLITLKGPELQAMLPRCR